MDLLGCIRTSRKGKNPSGEGQGCSMVKTEGEGFEESELAFCMVFIFEGRGRRLF